MTGAGGFVGGRLVECLQNIGAEVTALAHRSASAEGLSAAGCRVLVGDVRDAGVAERAVAEVDAIVHLASVVSTRSLAESRAVNVGGARNLAEAAARRDAPPAFVYVSSLAAAGPAPPGGAKRETDECRPASHYGLTKREAELELMKLAGRLPVTIVRPPGVFGPGDKNLLQLFKLVRRGWNVCAVSKQWAYSFVSVMDLAPALVAAASRGKRLAGADDPQATGVYFVADPRAYTFEQLANAMARIMGRTRVRHVAIPTGVCWAVATLPEAWTRLTGAKTYLNYDKVREAAAGAWVCDPSRAAEELGFAPELDLPGRLQETYDWYVRNGRL